MSKNNEKDSLEFEQTEELIKFGSENSKLEILISLFIAFSIFLTAHALWSIYDHWTDDSIPLAICPRTYNLDSPVVMEALNETSDLYKRDRWIRGFVRKYILNSYPRAQEDVVPFFSFVVNTSTGDVKRKYEKFLADSDSIESLIKSGYTTRFYPKNSFDLRVRSVDGATDSWVVEMDGYLVKNGFNGEFRAPTTLRYTIETSRPSVNNPYGLVVSDSNFDTLADFVSGRKDSDKKTEGEDE